MKALPSRERNMKTRLFTGAETPKGINKCFWRDVLRLCKYLVSPLKTLNFDQCISLAAITTVALC